MRSTKHLRVPSACLESFFLLARGANRAGRPGRHARNWPGLARARPVPGNPGRYPSRAHPNSRSVPRFGLSGPSRVGLGQTRAVPELAQATATLVAVTRFGGICKFFKKKPPNGYIGPKYSRLVFFVIFLQISPTVILTKFFFSKKIYILTTYFSL